MAGWGALMGLGAGMQEFSNIIQENQKLSWQAQQDKIKYERELALEGLRKENNLDVAKFSSEEALKRQELQNQFTTKNQEAQNAFTAQNQKEQTTHRANEELRILKQTAAISQKATEEQRAKAGQDLLKTFKVESPEELPLPVKMQYYTVTTGIDFSKLIANPSKPIPGEVLGKVMDFAMSDKKMVKQLEKAGSPEEKMQLIYGWASTATGAGGSNYSQLEAMFGGSKGSGGNTMEIKTFAEATLAHKQGLLTDEQFLNIPGLTAKEKELAFAIVEQKNNNGGKKKYGSTLERLNDPKEFGKEVGKIKGRISSGMDRWKNANTGYMGRDN